MKAMQRLLLAFIVLGCGSINVGKSQKSIQSIENETNLLWLNNIDSSQVYQAVKPKNLIHQREIDNFNEDDEIILKNLLTDNSIPFDIAKWDAIGDRMIARANVSEEAKRVVRQIKKQRPGFFWTLFRVAFETVNETRSVIQQINKIVNDNTLADNAPPPTTPKINSNENEVLNVSTTAAPFKFSPQYLQDFVRKNVRGLVRLFNIEWKDAVDQSQKNLRQFQKDVAQSVEPFLADNPAVY